MGTIPEQMTTSARVVLSRRSAMNANAPRERIAMNESNDTSRDNENTSSASRLRPVKPMADISSLLAYFLEYSTILPFFIMPESRRNDALQAGMYMPS
jgi:hypothetical protein